MGAHFTSVRAAFWWGDFMGVRSKDTAVVFEYHLTSTAEFWRRFGGIPPLAGKRVLDFGASTGGMLQRLLENGAAEAVGVDINPRAVGYGQERLKAFGDRAQLILGDVRELDIGSFDMIVSQNVLEHVMPLEEVVQAVVAKARPGADIYFGFSPMWYSPYGHHQYPPTKIPWYHLIFGEQAVLDAMARIGGNHYADIHDAGFNKATPDDFETVFRALPVEIVSLRRNIVSSGWKQRVADLFAPITQLPGLRKYMTVSMYVHMRKR
jgi:2-polyprenyl-3-methyl-5-hydroxy-6-metoxy-1,4-benzoquinol methylase